MKGSTRKRRERSERNKLLGDSKDRHGPYLTTAEAALYCRASPITIRSWISDGKLVPDARVGIGGKWLILRKTLDAFLRRCAEKSRDDAEDRAKRPRTPGEVAHQFDDGDL